MKGFLTVVCCSGFLSFAGAADISVLGTWSEVIDASDLAGGAGSKIAEQSATTTVDVSNTGSGSWRVLARISENTWNGSLVLSIRRTSGGSGSGSISGGESHIQLTATDTEIFSGSGDRSAIGIETRLSGISLNVQPNAYSAGIVFTIVP